MSTKTAFYAVAGEGVAPLVEGKIRKDILKRIEALGKLNDRYLLFRANRDVLGLLGLADEYQKHGRYGLPVRAEQIRLEAQELHGKRN